ncbi:MAG: glycoside hydrolase family 3 protein, partial [Candidatus Helarchaeota archaeon]|nr:glycoside hydrolase family 3 protein [Candidatus Helarchaeota archaeon]
MRDGYPKKLSKKKFTKLPFINSSLDLEVRVEDLLGRLTLKEKFALCSGRWWAFMHTKPMKRLGIKPFKMVDGPNGVGAIGTYFLKKTIYFPSAICRCATWNPELSEKFGVAIAQEIRDVGYHMLLAPGLNIHRTPLCGRTFEYQTEDPYLNKVMA